jgi:copper chaperone CopZ
MKRGMLAVFLAAAFLTCASASVIALDKNVDQKAKQAKVEGKAQETIALKKAIFFGSGIQGDLCAETIKKAFAKTKGVECVHVDVKSKLATFCFLPEKTNPEKIGSALEKAGYKSDLVKVADAECPCDKCDESCKHMTKEKEPEACAKKGCPFASQCKKVCK